MRRLVPFLLPILALSAGCGGSGTAHVSGVIKLNGQPLKGAHVSFAPIATDGINAPGPSSYGKTDANGRYTLRLSNPDQEGAVVGKHRVVITTLEEEQPMPGREDVTSKPREEPIPKRYNTKTTLTFEVPPEGTDSANFDLTSP
jgi:hypothetical protein